jgi:T-complex protein 1 subunit zeta
VNSTFVYKSAEERDKLVHAERKFTDDKVRQVIAFKQSVCTNGESFILINMKGIDPISLDMLHKAGIIGIRRAKRRNMERIPKACGGYSVNSFDELKADCLGKAKSVYEHVLGTDLTPSLHPAPLPVRCWLTPSSLRVVWCRVGRR